MSGRPREYDEVKRSALTIRTTPSIKDAISRAAERSGRSVTQEIEMRLMLSLERDKSEPYSAPVPIMGEEHSDYIQRLAESFEHWVNRIR